jgi:hypothetical protein
VAHELELRMREQMFDVLLSAREEVVDAQDVMAAGYQARAKMGSDEAGPARYEYSLLFHAFLAGEYEGVGAAPREYSAALGDDAVTVVATPSVGC